MAASGGRREKKGVALAVTPEQITTTKTNKNKKKGTAANTIRTIALGEWNPET